MMAFVIACKKFFGMRPGDTLKEFAIEIKALTPKDREEMAIELARELGVPVAHELSSNN